jgi:hypothetical protein
MRRTRRGATAWPTGTIPGMVMISERPAEAADRAIPGPSEGDLIVGAGHHSVIGTPAERSTRYVMLLHLPTGGTATAVRDALITTLGTLPTQLRRSLTWDQGKEMAQHREFSLATEIQVYFCDPHSPGQRGSNETRTGCCASIFRRAPTCSYTPPAISSLWPPHSTPDPAKHWTGKHQPSASISYSHKLIDHQCCNEPLESARLKLAPRAAGLGGVWLQRFVERANQLCRRTGPAHSGG